LARKLLTHHGNQHVEQEYRNENHENDENRFGQVGIRNIVQLRVLRHAMKAKVTKSINHLLSVLAVASIEK
jgi:hypothetical protein